MRLHDRFHGVYSLICNCVCILGFLLKEGAASFVDALLIAFITCGIGRVTLYTADFDAFDLFPACCLCCLYCSLAALCCCIFVAGADEGNNFRCIKIGINRKDRGLGSLYQRCCLIALQRSNDDGIICAGLNVSLNHVLLLIVCSLRGCALYINGYAEILCRCFCASLYILPVLCRGRLENHTDLCTVCAAAAGACCLLVTAAGAAASTQTCQHSTCQEHRCNSLHFHRSFSFSSFTTVYLSCHLLCFSMYALYRFVPCK